MTTNPFKYEVQRRFSDFYWLRTILVRDYPTVFVPPMASKSGQGSLEMEYLKKRALVLQRFIDCVGESEILRSSPHVLNFLKITDNNCWAKAREQMQKKVKKISVAISLIIRIFNPTFPKNCLKEKTASELKISIMLMERFNAESQQNSKTMLSRWMSWLKLVKVTTQSRKI